MSKPTGAAVAARAARAVAEGHAYAEMDCQAFVEFCTGECGGRMAYAGSNAMARAAARLDTLQAAQAGGWLIPGALLFIREETDAGLPARYRGDGLGDFSHVGIYIGDGLAITDADRHGASRLCDVVHSSATMGRVAGSTLKNGWTHAALMPELEYGAEAESASEKNDGNPPAAAAVGKTSAGESAVIAFLAADSGSTVNVRAAASRKAVVRKRLPIGACVRVTKQRNGWAHVTAEGVHGWVMTRFLASDRPERLCG